MKKFWTKKEYFAIGFIVAMFIITSVLSLASIRQLQGNARVVNFVGIVRGATQKLVKEELMGYQDDSLIARLDSIIINLLTGQGSHNLVVLNDKIYIDNMRRVQKHWDELQTLILDVRKGGDPMALFNSSQLYFTLVDETVFSAEAYSEKQVRRSINVLMGVNVIFVVFVVIGLFSVLRAITLKKRAEALDKIAYIDPLTQMENRASCQRLIAALKAYPPSEDLAVFMFDMNNLKIVNDFLGHQGGDRLIADFAGILAEATRDIGFVGRYGGDEFVAFLKNANANIVRDYLKKIDVLVTAYNNMRVNDIERLSFAAGYFIGNAGQKNIDDMINEADREMYAQKRKMKSF